MAKRIPVKKSQRLVQGFKIDKNIPPPQRNRRTRSIFPYKHMKVGESVLLHNITAGDQKRVYRAATYARMNYGMLFTTRTVEGGIRIWRIV